jgi:hypothetical protein
MPWCRGASRIGAGEHEAQFASWASDVHTFWPLMIHSRRAFGPVDSDARSDPEPGSE